MINLYLLVYPHTHTLIPLSFEFFLYRKCTLYFLMKDLQNGLNFLLVDMKRFILPFLFTSHPLDTFLQDLCLEFLVLHNSSLCKDSALFNLLASNCSDLCKGLFTRDAAVVSFGVVVLENCFSRELVWLIEGVMKVEWDKGNCGDGKLVTRLNLTSDSLSIFSVSKNIYCVSFQTSLSLILNI